jgi:hypothetical protein
METWIAISFWGSFAVFFILKMVIRSQEAFGKTGYMWKSSAEKQKFDLIMQLITVFGTISAYTFLSWLFFYSS